MEGISAKGEFLLLFVDLDLAAAGYTAGTHTTGNYCCVGGHTTAYSQDTLRSVHTLDVLRRCLQTNQDHSLALAADACSLGSLCVEAYLTCCCTRGSRKSLSDHLASL